MRRTKRRKYQELHFQNFWLLFAEQDVGNIKKIHFPKLWDSCAQNNTSEISKHACSGIMGLLCAEQGVGNLKNGLSRIMGLLCAEQDVGNLKKNVLPGSLGLTVRRTKRQKYRKTDFQEFWDSCAQNKASEISKHKNGLSGNLGLLCAEQSVGNLTKWTFRDSGTLVRRTKRRTSQKMDL